MSRQLQPLPITTLKRLRMTRVPGSSEPGFAGRGSSSAAKNESPSTSSSLFSSQPQSKVSQEGEALKRRVQAKYEEIVHKREVDIAAAEAENLNTRPVTADEKASSAKPTPPSRRTVYTEKPLPPGHALPQLKKGTTVARDLDDKLLPTQTTPTQLISPVKCIPRMNSWSYVPHNFKVEDANSLPHNPYLFDGMKDDFYDELQDTYEEEDKKLRSEREIDDLLLMDLVEAMTSSGQGEGEEANERKDERTTGPDEGKVQFTSKAIFSVISEHFPGKGTGKEIRKKYLGWKRGFKPLRPSALYCPNIDGELLEPVSREQAMNSFRSLFCRRCYKYDCFIHRQELLPFHPVPKVDKRNELSSQKEVDCGPNCFLHLDEVKVNKRSFELSLKRTNGNKGNGVSNGFKGRGMKKIFQDIYDGTWSAAEESLFRSVRTAFPTNYCAISSILMTKSCQDVYHFAQKEGPVGFVQEEGPIEEDSSSASGEKPNKPKTKLRLWSIHTQKLREVAGELRHAAISFVPCNHPGEECAQNCYCILTGKACEKFCHCSLDCINRYPGCECKGQCNTKQCPCYSDARECDADLCRCSAHEHEKSKIKCKNVGIQKAFHKHLVMGQSDVSGWGCFLKEGAVKNEFIGEYTGEIISDSEADRRGAVYDARNCSYLFALNEEFVVDAIHIGNKLRFCNHSAKNSNCYAKVLTVNSDQRIGVFAKMDIPPNTELLFDYNAGGTKWGWKKEFVPIEREIESGPTAAAPTNGHK